MVKSHAAPQSTPPSSTGGNKPSSFEQTVYQRNLFMNMALNMSWQLAIVVIVPLIAGFKLDEHFKTTPLYAVIGLVLAALGMAAVLFATLKAANARVGKDGK